MNEARVGDEIRFGGWTFRVGNDNELTEVRDGKTEQQAFEEACDSEEVLERLEELAARRDRGELSSEAFLAAQNAIFVEVAERVNRQFTAVVQLGAFAASLA